MTLKLYSGWEILPLQRKLVTFGLDAYLCPVALIRVRLSMVESDPISGDIDRISASVISVTAGLLDTHEFLLSRYLERSADGRTPRPRITGEQRGPGGVRLAWYPREPASIEPLVTAIESYLDLWS